MIEQFEVQRGSEKARLIENGFIPLDKSWIMRMGVLDLLHGHGEDTTKFLDSQQDLGDDLRVLRTAICTWNTNEPVDVGESGTLYRFLQFAAWKQRKEKIFIKRGSLRDRKICDDPNIVNYSLDDLLLLDNGTSQWASAAVLCGNDEEVEYPPYKLQVTKDAGAHWKEMRGQGKMWAPRYDETILQQASACIDLLEGKSPTFIPAQAEDYCFARAFGFIQREDAEQIWPSLYGHESNRFEEMEEALMQFREGQIMESSDHRVVQAIVMLDKITGMPARIKHPFAVRKSWPEFWKFVVAA